MGITVVYPLRKQVRGDGFRYSLRSLQNFGQIDQVWVVGGKPDWLTDVVHLPGNPHREKARNVLHNIRAAAKHPDMPAEFVLMNDDFYIMQPTTPAVHWRETLASQLDTLHEQGRTDWWTRILADTRAWLQLHGIDEPLSYEGHKPLPIVTADFLKVMADVPRGAALQARSIYGNLARIGGTQMPDSKFLPGDDGWRDKVYLSSNPSSFNNDLGYHVRRCFPDPSPWERH